jgi:hypothetical protein
MVRTPDTGLGLLGGHEDFAPPRSPAERIGPEWFLPWFRATLRAMQITVQLPDDLAQRPDPAREALEAFAIEGYRSGALSAYQTRMLLGFETRYELDGFLKEHGVWERAYSVEDLEKDAEAFERTA